MMDIEHPAEEISNKRYQIKLYLDHARQSLNSAAASIENNFYATAVNRSYYAIFYAASGLLLVKASAVASTVA